jgi:hypothetical protein
MKRKKQFVSPRVLEQVDVRLEKDLMVLAGSVQNVLTLRSMGIEVENYDFSEDNTEGYSVDWLE